MKRYTAGKQRAKINGREIHEYIDMFQPQAIIGFIVYPDPERKVHNTLEQAIDCANELPTLTTPDPLYKHIDVPQEEFHVF